MSLCSKQFSLFSIHIGSALLWQTDLGHIFDFFGFWKVFFFSYGITYLGLKPIL